MTTSTPPDASRPDASPPAIPPVRGSWWSRQRSPAFDMTYVYGLPIFCFVVDALLGGVVWNVAPVLAWLAAGLGMLAFAIRNRPMRPSLSAAVTGMIGTAGLFAGLVFLLLLPLSIFALPLLGIGLLGFVPLATAAVLLSETRHRWARGPITGDVYYMGRVLSAGLGALVFVTIPLVAHLAEQAYLQKQLARIASTKADQRMQGLMSLARYPLCLNACTIKICDVFKEGQPTIPAEVEQLKRILGSDPAEACVLALD